MILKTSDGRFFSLHVDHYEFPDEELGPTEYNPAEDFDTARFLVVTASFRNSDGSWQASAPEMTTAELRKLADWLESIKNGEPPKVGVTFGDPPKLGIYFTERDLEFSVDRDERILSVHASCDFRPAWATVETVRIDFPFDQIDLKEAILSIRSQLGRFPDRPEIGPSTSPDAGIRTPLGR